MGLAQHLDAEQGAENQRKCQDGVQVATECLRLPDFTVEKEVEPPAGQHRHPHDRDEHHHLRHAEVVDAGKPLEKETVEGRVLAHGEQYPPNHAGQGNPGVAVPPEDQRQRQEQPRQEP